MANSKVVVVARIASHCFLVRLTSAHSLNSKEQVQKAAALLPRCFYLLADVVLFVKLKGQGVLRQLVGTIVAKEVSATAIAL